MSINSIIIKDCCGCEACVQVCPKHCISFNRDSEGFCYPKVDTSLCLECGLCEKVCLVIQHASPKEPLECYAAWNSDNAIRLKSSSGGIFTALAEKTIANGGVVFGARFDEEWNVVHGYTETFEGLKAFQGSKYVQSRIGESYRFVEQFLKAGRSVLFTGGGCQIAGLRLFLRKSYMNLFLVEIACHGVPSPLIWSTYLKKITDKNFPKGINEINFRDKTYGWSDRKYRLIIKSHNEKKVYSCAASKDKYMNCFLRNLTIRPSCFTCSSKGGCSNADILIGDCWGIEFLIPEFNDNKGASLVIAYTKKGVMYINNLGAKIMKIDYEQALSYNRGIIDNADISHERQAFWVDFISSSNKAEIIWRYGRPLEPSFSIKIKMIIYYILKRIKRK